MRRLFVYLFVGSIAISASAYYNNVQLLIFIVPIITLMIGACEKKAEKIIVASVAILFFLLILNKTTILVNAQSKLEINQDISITGVVVDFPATKNERIGFEIYMPNLKEKVQCYINISEKNMEIKNGDVLEISGTAYAPDKKRNPGGFDFNLYLRAKEIYSVFYADADSVEFIGSNINPILKPFVDFREKLIDLIEKNMSDRNEGFLKGLVFGIKEMDDEQSRIFAKAGISHVLAVSGLHVGFIYGFLMLVAAKAKISDKTGFVFICLILILYTFLCGFTISVTRASAMAVIHQAAKQLKIHYDTLNALFFIGCINIIINPLTVYTASFLLSYSAVFSITVFYPFTKGFFSKLRIKILEKTLDALLITFAVQAFTFPIISFIFNGVSLISFILNLVVVPIAGFMLLSYMTLMPVMVFWDSGATIVLSLMNILTDLCFIITESFIDGKFSYVNVPAMSVELVLLYYTVLFMAVGYFYLNKKSNKLALSAWICALWILIVPELFLSKELHVTALDVGQGDSILIEAPGGENILIDGGGSYYRNIGEDIILKALLNKNIKKLDLVVCTHSHLDHMGGIIEVLEFMDIDYIMINPLEGEEYLPLTEEAVNKGTQIVKSVEDMKLELSNGVKLIGLYPGKDSVYVDGNNSSIVLKLIYDEISFLFTGDIESKAEIELDKMGKDLNSNVIKISHHGSDTSTTEGFISKVDPDYALISVGRNNRFSHPSDKTLERLSQEGIQYYRTDLSGAVVFSTDGKKLDIKTYIEGQP